MTLPVTTFAGAFFWKQYVVARRTAAIETFGPFELRNLTSRTPKFAAQKNQSPSDLQKLLNYAPESILNEQ